MLDLGLTADEERSFLATLRGESHQIRIRVELANPREKVVESLTAPQAYVREGSVQVDTSQDISRSLSLTLADPGNKLGFVADSPAQGSLYASRFASVRYGVWVDELGDWVDVPVFFGPLTGLQHTGEVIQLEAQGKEALLMAPHYAVQGYTIQKNMRLDDAIKKVARRAGERRWSIPRLRTRLRRARTVADESEPWRVIKGGEQDSNGKAIRGLIELGEAERHVFYDGRGRLCVRRAHRNPVVRITTAHMTEQPSITYDLLEFRNFVRVVGQRPKGSKRQVSARAALPAKHPLSPRALARNGEPRYLADFVEASLKTEAECRKRAEGQLDRKAKVGVEASISCLPIPHLEEHDIVRVQAGEYFLNVPARQFTIPLTASSPMTIGENRRVPVRRRKGQGAVGPGSGGRAGGGS